MVFHWSLSDSKSPQVSRTLLSILAVLSNAVIWIVSTRPPTSKSSRAYYYYYYYLRVFFFCFFFTSVLSDGLSLEFWVKASLLKSPGLFSVFWPFSTMLLFGWSPYVLQLPSSFFLLITIRSGLLDEIRWSVFIIIIIIIIWEFFTTVLVDDLEFEWQQVSLSLQDSSEYSGWSYQFCNLDDLHSSSYFQVLQSLFQSLVSVLSAPTTTDIIVTFIFHLLLSLLLLLLFHSLRVFHISLSNWSFHWGLSDNKSPLVSRILLSILADLSNVVVWVVSTRLLISKSSSPFNNHSVTVPRVPIIIGMNVTFMFHSFSKSLARSRYLSFFSFSFNFTLWSVHNSLSSLFCGLL